MLQNFSCFVKSYVHIFICFIIIFSSHDNQSKYLNFAIKYFDKNKDACK